MSDPSPGYLEICSCGATFQANERSLFASRVDFWSAVKQWRDDHKHDLQAPTNAVSTTAKGEFGFTRYVPEYEDDDD